ncbi:MAG: DUF5395 domain-containing protein [Gammaproteobacteria bacterium]|nr:DUF5395 domain-containing protein [Gammaproteobacteria bacterium]
MRPDVQVRLMHDGTHWIAENEILHAKGATFEELDVSLAHLLREHGTFPAGSKVRVFMGFDYDTIPTWIRQYAAHYFNRYITLSL